MARIENPQAEVARFAVRMGIGFGLTPDETAEAIRPGDAQADRHIGNLISNTVGGKPDAQLLDDVANALIRRL